MSRQIVAGALAALLAIFAGFGTAAAASRLTRVSCPFGTAYADGCTRAPVDGNFISPDFFAAGKQSGQGKYYTSPSIPSDHPPPWNVAGVDYPVGYPTSQKLKDPATSTLPAGCAYSAKGSANGGAIVVCAGVNGILFKGWDFSLHNCTVLDIKGDVTGRIAISNSKFVNGSNCSTATNGYLVMIESGSTASFKFKHNFVDGNEPNFPASLIALLAPFVTGEIEMKYNALVNSPARPIITNSAGRLMIAYNYWGGFVYQEDDGHGEVLVDAFHGQTQRSQVYSFNTVLQPQNAYAGSTTAFYTTTNYTDSTISYVQVDHNVVITNLNNGQVTTSATVSENCCNTYGSVVLDSNYADPTGSYYIFGSTSAPNYLQTPTFTGNVNMLDGNPVTSFNTLP